MRGSSATRRWRCRRRGDVTALPISGHDVGMRDLTGAEELMLLGAHASVPRLVGDLLRAIAEEGVEVDELPVGDAESLLLALRVRLLGDAVRADILCPSRGCGERIDVSFSIREYARHREPRRMRGVTDDDGGWMTSARDGVT